MLQLILKLSVLLIFQNFGEKGFLSKCKKMAIFTFSFVFLIIFLTIFIFHSFLNYTSKGSFHSRKKIVKVSFPGVVVCESYGIWELRCVGIAVCGYYGVWELRRGGCSAWESQ